MPTFLDDLIQPFYVGCPKIQADYAFGQIFWVTAYYPHKQLDVWRPSKYDPKLGVASDFNPRTPPQDAFRRQAPLAHPPLQTNEEFIVMKAKKRPVVLLQPPNPALALIPKTRGGGLIARQLCPVGLIYSAEDGAGNQKFSNTFIDRVRVLGYPEFMFLPSGAPVPFDSLVRFDELQSVYVNNLEPTGFRLADDAIAILKSQISFVLTGLAGKSFQEWAAELQA